jgi:translation elongation factor EF-Tu-like GTPase
LITGAAQMDGAILVVSAAPPQTYIKTSRLFPDIVNKEIVMKNY